MSDVTIQRTVVLIIVSGAQNGEKSEGNLCI